jgi:hypothetical protein
LLSPSTAQEDRTIKKRLYEQTFRTPDYFLYDPESQTLEGYHLTDGSYVALETNELNRLWGATLGLWLGKWEGSYLGEAAVWLRFFDGEGQLIHTAAEVAQLRAETERQRAEQAGAQASQLQVEVEQLRARLRAAGIDPDALD